MPKLWSATIQAHRHEVREAILRVTWDLVAGQGVRAVTMSRIAAEVGIGRATLYKYFPDVEAILVARHHQHVAEHLDHLTRQRDHHEDPAERLEAVLSSFAQIMHHRSRHDFGLAALVHRNEYIAGIQQQLVDLFRDLLADAAQAGRVRGDVPPAELAGYCLHALVAAERLESEGAVERLVSTTADGLHLRRDGGGAVGMDHSG